MPRRPAAESQAVRCIALLAAMARARRGVMLRLFAEEHGWNPRAAYRDLQTLRAAGVPIEQAQGRYQVAEGWIPAGATDVTRDELIALFAARRWAPGLRDTAFGHALESLWSKLASPGRQAGLPLGEEASLRGPAAGAIDLAPHRPVIEAAREAIRRRHALRIRYRKLRGGEHERVIEPSFLYWSPPAEALYLRAYCREREDFRWFAIHRIGAAALLEEPFARRRDLAWEDARAFQLWHRAAAERVSIRFSPIVAGEILERRWHATQHLTEGADGSVILEMDVAAPEELERWLLGYGPDVEVLAPASLAERLRLRHLAAAGLRTGLLRGRRSPPRAATAPGTAGAAAAQRRSPRR